MHTATVFVLLACGAQADVAKNLVSRGQKTAVPTRGAELFEDLDHTMLGKEATAGDSAAAQPQIKKPKPGDVYDLTRGNQPEDENPFWEMIIKTAMGGKKEFSPVGGEAELKSEDGYWPNADYAQKANQRVAKGQDVRDPGAGRPTGVYTDAPTTRAEPVDVQPRPALGAMHAPLMHGARMAPQQPFVRAPFLSAQISSKSAGIYFAVALISSVVGVGITLLVRSSRSGLILAK